MQLINDEHKPLGVIIRNYMPNLTPYEALYKDIHRHPELCNQERRTAGIVEERLRALGYDVHTHIGGYGLVGVLRNGSGKTVLLRADMDALPLKEETGVPYASLVEQKNDAGEMMPVMHACGHDMHTTCLIATADLLRAASSHWRGTLICLFQPSEERGTGAQAMVDDGLYERVPIPDVVLGQHTSGSRRAGRIAMRAGPFLGAADSYVVRIHGRSAHGSQPHHSIDPIVLASHIIIRLQTIVSRMIDPIQPAVLTCGSIHAGSTENIIPSTAELKLDIRSFDTAVHETIVNSMKKVIRAECSMAGCPREPDIEQTRQYPLTINNEQVVKRLRTAMMAYFGADDVVEAEMETVSEDISNLARPNNTPMAYYMWGTTAHDEYDRAKEDGTLAQLHSNHSSQWAPAIQPTMRSGVEAFSLAALCYLS